MSDQSESAVPEADPDQQTEAPSTGDADQGTDVSPPEPTAETSVQDGEPIKDEVQEEQGGEGDVAAAPEVENEREEEAEEQESKPEEVPAETGPVVPNSEEPANKEAPASPSQEEVSTKNEQLDAEQQQSKVPAPVVTPEPERETAGTVTDPTTENHEVDPHAASPTSRFDKEATATVKVVLMPSGQVVTIRWQLGQTLFQLKQHFSTELKVPLPVILLMFDGKPMADELCVGDLGVGPNGTVQLELQSSDPVNTPIKAFRPRQEYHMPDVITVRVQAGESLEDNAYNDVVVEIERPTQKKPFLGGYRHKKTNLEYHHASAQTMQKQKAVSTTEKFCRDTQTVQQKHAVQQTTNNMTTQMTKIGVYVPNLEDKLVVPGKYTTADEFKKNVLDKVIVIQKYYRRWLAKQYVEKVRIDQRGRQEWERKEEIRKKKEKEDRIQHEFERRMDPKSKEDFDLLYHALEKWRKEEEERINSCLTGAERKAALCQLLDQETQLIASIGRHKLDADKENKIKGIMDFLNKAAAPKKWKGPDGKNTQMDTPYTIRAQELRDIYNTVNVKYLTQDERLDVLLTLKHTVKEHDCKLTQEIIELIDREADLLMRGVKESNLEGLRKRISTLFLQYIKTPTFNPEAARLLKVPQDPTQLQKNIYFCPSCSQYLPSTDFQLSSNTRTVGKCRRCLKKDNDARVRHDHSHYRYMLKTLLSSEENYSDNSKIAFLLQESDLRHLVEKVWNSQSALSSWDDLYDLVLVRWDRHDEWSPWNCVLLTKEEASAHEKLERMEEAYGKEFIHKVQHKHTLGRNYFSRLPNMGEHMRSRPNSNMSSLAPSISGKAVPVMPTKA